MTALVNPETTVNLVGTFESDADGRILSVNSGMTAWLPQIAKDSCWFDFLPTEYRVMEKSNFDQVASKGAHGPSRKELSPNKDYDNLAGRVLVQHSIMQLENVFWHLISKVQTSADATRAALDYETKIGALTKFHQWAHEQGKDCLQEVLATTTQLLNQEIGIISDIQGDNYLVKLAYAPGKPLQAGATFELGQTYCQIARQSSEDVLVIEHMASSMHAKHPCYKAFGLESYLGTHLSVHGKRIGTINFTSGKSRRFSSSDIDLVRLVGQFVGMVLERDASARLLKRERDIRDALLSNLLPKPIIARLETLAQNADGLQRANSSSATSEQSMSVLFDQILSPAPDMHDSDNSVTIADEFDNVTLVFVDFAGFTTFCADRTPIEVVRFLNAIYYALDKAAAKHGLMKIKTIGDCYLAMGGGLRTSQELEPRENAANTLRFGLESIDVAQGFGIRVRVGVASGPVVGGIVGTQRIQYDVWGDTVNTASRMESHGAIGRVQASVGTQRLLADSNEFVFESRGEIQVKGKGTLETFWVERRRQ